MLEVYSQIFPAFPVLFMEIRNPCIFMTFQASSFILRTKRLVQYFEISFFNIAVLLFLFSCQFGDHFVSFAKFYLLIMLANIS